MLGMLGISHSKQVFEFEIIYPLKLLLQTIGVKNYNCLNANLKFSDGDGPNLCRVKKQMLVPHLLKIYFGLG